VQIGMIYRADGTTERIRPANAISFSLIELQRAVGGNIEHVRMAPGNGHAIMLVNERGKPLDLPPNAKATALLHPMYEDRVVGDAIVLTRERGHK
jgi:hypothetical protein